MSKGTVRPYTMAQNKLTLLILLGRRVRMVRDQMTRSRGVRTFMKGRRSVPV